MAKVIVFSLMWYWRRTCGYLSSGVHFSGLDVPESCRRRFALPVSSSSRIELYQCQLSVTS